MATYNLVMTQAIVVGVLALQGAFLEHIKLFQAATQKIPGHEFSFIEVRTANQLKTCQALVIPGGESTAMSHIAQRTGIIEPLMEFIKSERPVWGTCAGLIFLSKQLVNGKPEQTILGALDIEVTRNAFGRQLQSFSSDLDFSSFIEGVTDFPTIFIRAPVVTKAPADKHVTDSKVIQAPFDYKNESPLEVLHKLDTGLIVAVRQGQVLGTSFHPELGEDSRFHQWFLQEFVLASI